MVPGKRSDDGLKSKQSSRSIGAAPVAAKPYSRHVALVWAVLALLVGLGLTAVVQRRQQQDQHRHWIAGLQTLANKSYQDVRAQLHSGELFLRAVQSLYLASEDVTEAEFDVMFSDLRPRDRFPSLQALAFAERVVRPDGVHFITNLVAPKQGNQALQGLDVLEQPNNLDGLSRSRDSDEATLSAPFRLIQHAHSTSRVDGVTLRLPIYNPGRIPTSLTERRERMRGSIAVSFKVSELIGNALPPEALQQFHVRIRDVTDGLGTMLFDSRPQVEVSAQSVVFDHVLDYGGRKWAIWMQPLRNSPPAEDSPVVLLGGILASVLLALLVYSIVHTRRRALAMAQRMSERFQESERRFRTLNELLPALVVLANAEDGSIVYANQAARMRLGDGIEGQDLAQLFFEPELYEQLRQHDAHGPGHVEARLGGRLHASFWASVSLTRVWLEGDQKLLMVASDITKHRQLTEMLSYQASHDALTGLYNRREFEQRLEQVLVTAVDGMAPAVLLYIDLDQFKLVNDTSGHAAGDRLLTQLTVALREYLDDGQLLARLGGDEFGILASNLPNTESAHALAERVRRCVDDVVFTWEGYSHMVSASIGGVLIDRPGMSMKDLFTRADTACYVAKEAGRNRVHFHSSRDVEVSLRQREMEWANRLRWAISEQRLVLVYQEIRPLSPDAPAGASMELLLRYRDDDGKLLTPGVFMPAAERYGLMPTIDRWVVETALANFDQLHPEGAGLRNAAINLSGASIENDAFADRIIALLKEHKVDPSRVCFEITETMAVRHLRQVITFIERLRAVGCRTSLDDFGTGQSSFSYLKNLPVDTIKIDGSFVRDMLSNPVSHSVVKAVADIGDSLDLEVVAEWVPDDATLQVLGELGVDYAQGFLLHEPEVVVFQRS